MESLAYEYDFRVNQSNEHSDAVMQMIAALDASHRPVDLAPSLTNRRESRPVSLLIGKIAIIGSERATATGLVALESIFVWIIAGGGQITSAKPRVEVASAVVQGCAAGLSRHTRELEKPLQLEAIGIDKAETSIFRRLAERR